MATLLARTVHFIVTAATLLSGDLDKCRFPTDATCEAGVASVAAWPRNLTQGEPFTVLPVFDKSSPFVQMHPLGWSVNRLVFQQIMGWEFFTSTPALLTQHEEDQAVSSRDLSDVQTGDFPFLLSNVAIPPSNSWAEYAVPIYFDQETGLAVLSVSNNGQSFNVEQVGATIGLLNYIERVNQWAGCGENEDTSLFDHYVNRTTGEPRCWIPIVVYGDNRQHFFEWLSPVVNHKHPPALIINIEEEIEDFKDATRVGFHGVWVVSYELTDNVYIQEVIEIAEGGRKIDNVSLLVRDMDVLPPEVQDETYLQNLVVLRALADEAESNDPVVGMSTAVPAQRDGSYRRCKSGECEVGNIFTDAIAWYTDSDFAFQSSGGFRGPGWPAGEVAVSDIFAALPFDNTICTGTISGVSLFKLFNFSVSIATFEGENTDLGDRLLQISSGLRISYNLQLPEETRLVAMEVLNKETGEFESVERLALYSFSTDSFMCSAFTD